MSLSKASASDFVSNLRSNTTAQSDDRFVKPLFLLLCFRRRDERSDVQPILYLSTDFEKRI
jgi:hypothetical protein